MKAKEDKTGPRRHSPVQGKGHTVSNAKQVAAQVASLAEPLCRAEGLELVHVEFQREAGGRTLRLYIDKPGGVQLEDCTIVSRQLSDILDVALEADDAYNLEVSSPGSNRPLGKPQDFTRFKGHAARIRLAQAREGRKNFTGSITDTSPTSVTLRLETGTVEIAFEDIAKAQLINYNGES